MKNLIRRAISAMPAGIRYSLFQELARTLNVGAIEIRGLNGRISGMIDDLTITRGYAERGVWDRYQIAFCAERLAAGGTFIDVGANIGTVAIPIGQLPGVSVVAIEPEPENFLQLSRNVAGNGLKGARLFNVGLWDRPGKMKMAKARHNFGDHRLSLDGDEVDRDTVDVDVATLDSLLDTSNLLHPIVLKIDTQGAEPFVLSGGSRTLSDVDVLLIEYGQSTMTRLGGSAADVLNVLKGFRKGAAFPGWTPIPTLSPISEVVEHLSALSAHEELDVVACR